MATAAEAASASAASTKGARTRQAILDAAIARFGRDGYRGTSVAEIARDAGVSGTASYAYFPSKESLFVAAVDADATAVIDEGLTSITDEPNMQKWRGKLIFTLLAAIRRHPLARRILAGLEPDFTVRLLQIPALQRLRAESADRMRRQQRAGHVRGDIDADTVSAGIATITLSLLMTLVQTGGDPATLLGPEVAAVFEAALEAPA
jgi:AcrR family transcriptional regulator